MCFAYLQLGYISPKEKGGEIGIVTADDVSKIRIVVEDNQKVFEDAIKKIRPCFDPRAEYV